MIASYRGRFAPSPTGPLHRGSLVAALASWLDARANDGKWLIRIENLDPPRERAGASAEQIATLGRLGMSSDEPIVYQSERSQAYDAALQQLRAQRRTFCCICTRTLLAGSGKGPLPPYPGTCRARPDEGRGAIRFRVDSGPIGLQDRACGSFVQDLQQQVGDFVIRRADGLWAYQLAVVVDDGFQQITHVVRGADLLENTPRQIALQRALALGTPSYLHVPLVRDALGRKLSKQTDAPPVDPCNALGELEQAWRHLGFSPTGARTVAQFQRQAIAGWRRRWCEALCNESNSVARHAAPST